MGDKKQNFIIFKTVLVILILSLSLFLRIHNYTEYPQRGATSDEYTYSFLGLSLLKNHIPISWSAFPEYKNPHYITIKGIVFPIVKPYFDHPPLNGLLVGGFVYFSGQDTFEKIKLSTIRVVPILLGMISSILVFLIALQLYDFKTAIFALLIFSTSTIFVMNMRVVVAENLLVVFFLLTTYIFTRFKKLSFKSIILIGIFSGLSLWTKILGFTLFVSSLSLLSLDRYKKKHISVFISIFLIFFILLLLYGAFYDWNLFLQIQTSQGSRNIGPLSLLMLLNQPVIVNKVYFDGWYFFGFLALFFSFLDFKENKYIIIPSLFYLLILTITLTKEGQSGWYAILLFPYMAIASARFVTKLFEKPSFAVFIFLIFIGYFHIENIYASAFGLSSISYRILFILLFLPCFISLFAKKDTLYRFLVAFYFYFFILGNFISTFYYIHPA